MGFKIIKTERLNPVTTLFEIEARLIARRVKAGQFIVVRMGERSERIPLTIAKTDLRKGVITIIFQEAGKSTKELATLKQGDEILDLIGPLGKPADFGKVGRVVFVGGGIGTAEILPVVEYAKSKGNEIAIIIGARTKKSIIFEEELRNLSPGLIITTDDGSCGIKGLVTEPLVELLKKEKFDLAYCVGPDVMMKETCAITKQFDLKTLVSLDANMVDATGMCGTCRVSVGGETKFTCVDGPEFDGHLVDWDEFLKRQKRFKDEEGKSLELYNKHCKCRK